jgi:hypothetical protein
MSPLMPNPLQSRQRWAFFRSEGERTRVRVIVYRAVPRAIGGGNLRITRSKKLLTSGWGTRNCERGVDGGAAPVSAIV